MAQTVIGIFDNVSEAQDAIDQLVRNGFTREYIDLATHNTSSTSDATDRDRSRDEDESFGSSVGNFFSNLFGSDDEVDKYSDVGRRGTVVTVHAQTSDEAERAADILDEYGAVDVDERYSQFRNNTDYVSDSGTLNAVTDRDAYTDRGSLDTDETLKVIEEDLQVGKREVRTGGVRLRSRIIEKPVEENLRLRVEHVRVERNPVNRLATDADLNAFREGEIELTERAEVPVVSKEARVVEEISLSKEVEEREETIRDTVRRTDVEVENLNSDDTLRRTTDEEYRRRENL